MKGVGFFNSIFFLVSLGFFCLAFSACSPPQNDSDLVHLRQLKDQAFSGDPESQYQLGIHYTTNGQWTWNSARGYGWFLEAAESGHVDAQYMVGMSQLLGRGTTQNESGALVWLIRAAEQGHGRSQYQLAQAYLNGTGTVKDPFRGRYWLEQAAWGGHAQGQFLLAALFKKGLGGRENPAEALVWLKRSAQNGNREAERALERLAKTLTATEQEQAGRLLKKVAKADRNGLYQIPKVRYIQALLNAMGFTAGDEDGEYGSLTRKAVQQYLQQKALPRDASIDEVIEVLRGIGPRSEALTR